MRSEPHGYTLIIVSATMQRAPPTVRCRTDPVNDIQAITHIGTTGLLFTVHPSLPVKNIPEVIAYATARRSSYLPDVPAVSESVPGYEAKPRT